MRARTIVLYVGGAVVLIAAIGAVYLEIALQSRATHSAWMVTEATVAGAPFTVSNVRSVRIPAGGEPLNLVISDPVSDHRRAGHRLDAGHLLAQDDVLSEERVLVPITFKAAPPLNKGDQVDVYVNVNGRTVQVGRSLVVETSGTLWVPPLDEPNWITLQASNAPLYAVRSTGIGVPEASSLTLQDAVASLSGGGGSSRGGTQRVPDVSTTRLRPT
jgi:hypothetical protein